MGEVYALLRVLDACMIHFNINGQWSYLKACVAEVGFRDHLTFSFLVIKQHTVCQPFVGEYSVVLMLFCEKVGHHNCTFTL